MSRAYGILAAGLLGLLAAACTGAPPPAMPSGSAIAEVPPAPPSGPRRIALLLPLSGPRADLAQSLLHAAQLALSVQGAPELDVRDTGGDPARAASAAHDAIEAGDPLILGPLTAEETIAVAAVSTPAQIPVLAFTSDPAAISPGVWALGLTPEQQMRRLVVAARDDGRARLAAVLPPGALGDALQTAFAEATTDAGFAAPAIQRSTGGLAGFLDALKTVSNYDERRGELEGRLHALRQSSDADARQQAAALAAQPTQPPPFDALLIGESGDVLRQAAQTLNAYDVEPPQVRILGPALWSQQAGRLGRLAGAWYAALDPSQRGEFVTAYMAKFGSAPAPLADYAFDAAAVARVLAGENDFSIGALSRSEGFTGVDGALTLLPDGHVRRALAVWQISSQGGARIVSPAPQDLATPGS